MILTAFSSGLYATILDPEDPLINEQIKCKEKGESFNDTPYEYYCYVCKLCVTEGSKHCKACNKCVLHFDHHCKWLNNCIGSLNYKPFIMFIASAELSLIIKFIL